MLYKAAWLAILALCLCGASDAHELAWQQAQFANGSGNAPEPRRSAGCGAAGTGTGEFKPLATQVNGRDRSYHLRVPRKYDANRAYPLIFRWHGRGGDGLSGGLGIEFSAGDDAIIVGADGFNKTWDTSAASEDLAFFDSMLAAVEERYCIDRNRVFSYGFSAGGFFTNYLACERSDVLRASAAIAGGPSDGSCKGRVAGWFLHDTGDDAVPMDLGESARDRALAANGCSADASNAGDGCVRYAGCGSAPVVWCQSSGFGHDIRGDFAPPRVWKFFQQLR